MKKDALLTIIAEWLEEWEVPPLVPRNQPVMEPADIKRILAIVGPRRAGKTYYMYQLIQYEARRISRSCHGRQRDGTTETPSELF